MPAFSWNCHLASLHRSATCPGTFGRGLATEHGTSTKLASPGHPFRYDAASFGGPHVISYLLRRGFRGSDQTSQRVILLRVPENIPMCPCSLALNAANDNVLIINFLDGGAHLLSDIDPNVVPEAVVKIFLV